MSAMHTGLWIGAAVVVLGAVIAATKLPAHQRSAHGHDGHHDDSALDANVEVESHRILVSNHN